jgi:hypothetical protein
MYSLRWAGVLVVKHFRLLYPNNSEIIQSVPQSSRSYKTGRATNEPTIPTFETKRIKWFSLFSIDEQAWVISYLSHKCCSERGLEEESLKNHTKERLAMSSLHHFRWRLQLATLRCPCTHMQQHMLGKSKK